MAAGRGEHGRALAMLRCKLGRRVRLSRVSVSCLGMVGGSLPAPQGGKGAGEEDGREICSRCLRRSRRQACVILLD